MKNIYLKFILIALIMTSCALKQNSQIAYEKDLTEIIKISTTQFLFENANFLNYQKDNGIGKIYIGKEFRLNSGMLDWGIPSETIPGNLKPNRIPKKIFGITTTLISERKIEKSKLDNFQYLFLYNVMIHNSRANLVIRRIYTINKITKSEEIEYKLTKNNIKWEIISE